MKKYPVLPFVTELLLALLVSVATMGCMISGLALHLQIETVVIGLFLGALGGIMASRFSKGLWFLLGGMALYILLLGNVAQHGKNLFLLIGRLCHLAYRWDVGDLFQSLGNEILEADVTSVCAALAVVLAGMTAWTLGRRKSLWICLPLQLIPVTLTLLVLDTVPELPYIALLLVSLPLLMMTHTVRRRLPKQAAVLTLALFLPIALCANLLLEANPREGYVAPDDLLSFLYQRADELPFIGVDKDGNVTFSPDDAGSYDRVNLSAVGPRNQSQRIALRVQTTLNGTLYLRGQSYSDYTGTRWTNFSSPEEEVFAVSDYYREATFSGLQLLVPFTNLTITPAGNYRIAYVPYYPDRTVLLEDGKYINPGGTQYSYYVNPLVEGWENLWQNIFADNPAGGIHGMDVTGLEAFLQLPDSTRQQAQSHLQQLALAEDVRVITAADIIASYVRSSAQYSLGTQRMPWGQDDFAMWFLENSDTGYCVHFATAATVLLRAAGIPARYVEGYAVVLPAGRDASKQVPVRETMAHAWCEYYVPGVGWVILEATPSAGIEVYEPQASTAPSTGTTAPTTQAPSDPSQSTAGESTAAAEQSGTQSSTGSTQTPPPPTQLEGLFQGLGITAGILLLLAAQYILRVRLRWMQLHRGDTNRQALARWRYGRLLAWLRQEDIPESLTELAKKARFSQHQLTAAELQVFADYFAESIGLLRKKNFLWRLLYRLILAAW